MPPKKRSAAGGSTDSSADSSTDPVAKKYKSAMDEMADEWICPITTELPIDPVMAEDERIYERAAVEEHIRTQGAELKSPPARPRGRALATRRPAATPTAPTRTRCSKALLLLLPRLLLLRSRRAWWA